MIRYGVGIAACLFLAVLYPYFRYEIFEELLSRRIRKRDIRQKMKGAGNFWLYREIEAAYGLGWYGKLMRHYTLTLPAVAVLHLALGWVDRLAGADMAIMSLLCVTASVLIFYTGIRRNRRSMGSAFILFAWSKTYGKTGKHLHTEVYSTFIDIAFAAFPLVFPAVMLL